MCVCVCIYIGVCVCMSEKERHTDTRILMCISGITPTSGYHRKSIVAPKETEGKNEQIELGLKSLRRSCEEKYAH